MTGPAQQGWIGRGVRAALPTVVATLITLAVAEAGLRLLDFRILREGVGERSLTYAYDAELGWAPIPNSSSSVTTARTIQVQHNSLGLRDVEPSRDGRPRIMFIGDSFVWGVDAEANERFTDLVRGRIASHAVVNAGVSGYGTDQQFLLLQRLWPMIEPAVVVLIFCANNDRADNSTNVRYDDYQKPYFATARTAACGCRASRCRNRVSSTSGGTGWCATHGSRACWSRPMWKSAIRA